jgi:hypothetical protein
VEVLAKTDKLRQTVTNRAGFIRLSFVIYSRVPGPHPCWWTLPCLGLLFYQSVSYIRLSAAKKLQFTASFSWVLFCRYKNFVFSWWSGTSNYCSWMSCSTVDLSNGLRLGKPTRPCLWPVTGVFQLKKRWAEGQSRFFYCEVMQLFTVASCFVKAVHKCDFELTVNESLNKWRLIVAKKTLNHALTVMFLRRSICFSSDRL